MNNTQYMRSTNIKLINTKKKQIKYNKTELSAYNLLAVIYFQYRIMPSLYDIKSKFLNDS